MDALLVSERSKGLGARLRHGDSFCTLESHIFLVLVGLLFGCEGFVTVLLELHFGHGAEVISSVAKLISVARLGVFGSKPTWLPNRLPRAWWW